MPDRDITFWKRQARTASFSERDIIRWIIELFNNGEPFDADVTYSTGHIWTGLPQPRFRFDLKPQAPDTIAADCRMLPLADGSLKSIMFDPPFNVRSPSTSPVFTNKTNHPMQRMIRFSVYPTAQLLFAFYSNVVRESARVIADAGLLVVKIQDCVNGSSRLWSSDHIIRCAESSFGLIERFVLISNSIVWRMEPKYHARAAHCYYLCFRRKGKRAKR